jgi:hypothetical protein
VSTRSTDGARQGANLGHKRHEESTKQANTWPDGCLHPLSSCPSVHQYLSYLSMACIHRIPGVPLSSLLRLISVFSIVMHRQSPSPQHANHKTSNAAFASDRDLRQAVGYEKASVHEPEPSHMLINLSLDFRLLPLHLSIPLSI